MAKKNNQRELQYLWEGSNEASFENEESFF